MHFSWPWVTLLPRASLVSSEYWFLWLLDVKKAACAHLTQWWTRAKGIVQSCEVICIPEPYWVNVDSSDPANWRIFPTDWTFSPASVQFSLGKSLYFERVHQLTQDSEGFLCPQFSLVTRPPCKFPVSMIRQQNHLHSGNGLKQDTVTNAGLLLSSMVQWPTTMLETPPDTKWPTIAHYFPISDLNNIWWLVILLLYREEMHNCQLFSNFRFRIPSNSLCCWLGIIFIVCKSNCCLHLLNLSWHWCLVAGLVDAVWEINMYVVLFWVVIVIS